MDRIMIKGKELYNILNDDDFHFKGSKSSYDKLENINFDSHRKHKFLLLNRRLKPHRIILLSLLENHDLLKDNLVSYDLDMLYCKDDPIEHLKNLWFQIPHIETYHILEIENRLKIP